MGIKLNLEIKEASFWSIESRGSKAFWSSCLWSLRRSSEGNKMFSALYTRINFHLSQRLLRKPKSITWIEIHFKACLFKKTQWKVDFDHKKVLIAEVTDHDCGEKTHTVEQKQPAIWQRVLTTKPFFLKYVYAGLKPCSLLALLIFQSQSEVWKKFLFLLNF